MAETREDVLHRDFMPLSRLVELQEHELQCLRAKLQAVRELVTSDALAITYQTLGQYRKALLAAQEGA